MRSKHLAIIAILPIIILAASVRADDLRSQMEEANTKWLAAFNTPNPAAFPALYTVDAILLFQGVPIVAGSEAIKQFWESRIKMGVKDHTFEIIETWADGKYAYQLARASAVLQEKRGSGHTLRIFERQSDGTWKTKAHMYNRPN